jgi:hypothetical protein
VTEDLRALLRADLSAERPPPLGDVVDAAIREGRRMRRNRRIAALGAAFALVAGGAVLVGDGEIAARTEPVAAPPQSVPITPAAAPTALAQARTLTIHSGTVRVDGLQTKATSAAMLHLLTLLLPPGRTSHYAVAPDDDLRVQLYLDEGNGPALVRVELGKITPYGEETPRDGTVTVKIQHMPDNCAQSTMVDARRADGLTVHVEVADCLPPERKPTGQALTTDQAVRIATDPRWGLSMDAGLVATGRQRFARTPALS